MADKRTFAEIAAQIAVEAVIDHAEDYEAYAVEAVYENGKTNNVSSFYLDMIREGIENKRLSDIDHADYLDSIR